MNIQYTHVKLFSIISYQRKVKGSTSLHSREWLKLWTGNIKCWWQCRNTGSNIESKKLYNLKKVFKVSCRVKVYQSYFPAIPLLDTSPKEIKKYVLKIAYIRIFIYWREKTQNMIFTQINTSQK